MDDAIDLGFARRVGNRHKDELLRRFHAVGLGRGKQAEDKGGGYVIVVYLESEHRRPTTPVTVEGVPVLFEVTGQIRPLASAAG